MANPILQMINKSQNNGINNLISMAKGNPQGVFDQLMSNNPQFRSFIEANRGKSPEQIANEYGINFGSIQNLMK